jgi:hypothetical protein
MPRAFLRSVVAFGVLLGMAFPRHPVAAETAATETVVLIRHGEKPALGLGQLDCRGLNRALALPAVISKAFGKPDAIFAPNPAVAKVDLGHAYDYVRPLATIEPTAIVFGLPVDTSIGFSNIDGLRRTLDAPAHRGTLILVAWEHDSLVKVARALMARNGGDPAKVPEWPSGDFDSIYVVRITRTGVHAAATFEQRREGLDGEPSACLGQPPG